LIDRANRKKYSSYWRNSPSQWPSDERSYPPFRYLLPTIIVPTILPVPATAAANHCRYRYRRRQWCHHQHHRNSLIHLPRANSGARTAKNAAACSSKAIPFIFPSAVRPRFKSTLPWPSGYVEYSTSYLRSMRGWNEVERHRLMSGNCCSKVLCSLSYRSLFFLLLSYFNHTGHSPVSTNAR